MGQRQLQPVHAWVNLNHGEPLAAETDTTDSDLTLSNKLDLNGSTRTIEVNSHTALMPGDIRTSSGTAGITKTGNGRLVLSGANTYDGNTTVSGGALSMARPTTSGTPRLISS